MAGAVFNFVVDINNNEFEQKKKLKKFFVLDRKELMVTIES
jgi:hypothetical protein